VLALVQAVPPAPPDPEVRITKPEAADRLVGEVVLAADVDAVAVKEVQFFVDGVSVCRVVARPFQCRWTAGSVIEPHAVRVVALLEDGRRFGNARRTAGSNALFRTSSDVVLVPVRVTDGHGRPLAGLDRGDFQITEDGRSQELTLFAPQETPCSIMVALDVSGSMAPSIDRLRTAVRGFLSRARPQDAITLSAFNTGLFVLSPAEAEMSAKIAAVDGLRAGGGTALYDVMAHAANALKRQPGPRALVMFTDGDDVSSRASVDGARAALQGADVVLFLIAQGRAAADPRLRKQLSALADETGGEAFFASGMTSLPDHLAEILSNLSRQYLLGYTPAAALGDGAWRTIEVAVTKSERSKHAAVRARAGYFAIGR
jgi:Ca-activated chloride channel family protein